MYAMKAFISTCVAMAVLASTPAFGNEQARIKEQVAFGLEEIKRILANGSPEEFGLQSHGELAQLKVGAPIQAYRLDPSGLEAYTPGQRITPILTPMDELYYPVMVNGKARFVLWLAKLEGIWQFAGFGQADLGPALSGLLAKFARGGANLKMVIQAQTQAKMALVEQNGKEKLFYISSLPWSFNNAIRSDLTELRQPEMMEQLKEATRQMLTPAH